MSLGVSVALFDGPTEAGRAVCIRWGLLLEVAWEMCEYCVASFLIFKHFHHRKFPRSHRSPENAFFLTSDAEDGNNPLPKIKIIGPYKDPPAILPSICTHSYLHRSRAVGCGLGTEPPAALGVGATHGCEWLYSPQNAQRCPGCDLRYTAATQVSWAVKTPELSMCQQHSHPSPGPTAGSLSELPTIQFWVDYTLPSSPTPPPVPPLARDDRERQT